MAKTIHKTAPPPTTPPPPERDRADVVAVMHRAAAVADALFQEAFLLNERKMPDEAAAVLKEIERRFGAGAVEKLIELEIALDQWKAVVENRKKTTYNPLVKQPPDIGALEKKLDLIEAEYGEAAKEAFARRAPARDGAINSGMVARGREVTGRDAARRRDVKARVMTLARSLMRRTEPGRDAAPVAESAPQEAKTEAQAFAAALDLMTLKGRRGALAAHYGLAPDKDGNYALPEEKKWANVRGTNPTPEKFLAWLDDVFPDRREIGMVLSDLKYLDKEAYDKVGLWSGKRSKVTRAEIDDLGLPSRMTKYDPVRDANAPASFAEVVERATRGEDSFKKLTRTFARVRHHVPAG